MLMLVKPVRLTEIADIARIANAPTDYAESHLLVSLIGFQVSEE